VRAEAEVEADKVIRRMIVAEVFRKKLNGWLRENSLGGSSWER
jgi:hypothetical protein